ncbi:MAG: hypothetical protein IPO36_18670 [Anaerolineales bacterium]|nr:hypothetical protein [Anaerolineales bacterium]
MIHALDVMIAALRGFRDDIEKEDDDGVAARLGSSAGRTSALVERRGVSADWTRVPAPEAVDMPTFSERFWRHVCKKHTKNELLLLHR